jgi:sodium transport system permease protein
MGLTSWIVVRAMGSLAGVLPSGFPPLLAMVWLLVALVPASALFGSLCLALAVFARSTKEGQYYLMPLILIAMPLMVLPMAPGVELTLGNSLIPLTGLILLLKKLLEGNVWDALPYIPPVALVTLVCCRIAMRWAVDQFNKENVLFRESERWDFRLWLRHLRRDRGPTPTLGMAVVCGVAILSVQFFMNLALASSKPESTADLVRLILTSQSAVLLPAILMTFALTRDPLRTLRFGAAGRASVNTDDLATAGGIGLVLPLLAAAALAFALQPFTIAAGSVLSKMYPVAPELKQVEALFGKLAELPFWAPYLLLGLLPAFCEELAFRGFILSGLRHSGSKWRAILISSLFFAVTHQILQQSLLAFVFGILLGYLCVQTGSLWPGLVFHAIHNGLGWAMAVHETWLDNALKEHETLCWFLLLLGLIAAGLIIAWFGRLQYRRTDEEQIREAIEHETAGAAV